MQNNLQKIHDASMRLLSECGIKILHDKVLNLLTENGIKVVGQTVFFTEQQLMGLVKKAPACFTLYARNPQYNASFGDDHVEFAPGYGAPSIIDNNGIARAATIKDYLNLIKLFHQSPHHKINGGVVVQPTDLPGIKSRPIMAYLALTHSDKCLMVGTGEAAEAKAITEMAALAFGGKEAILAKPRIMTIINMNSPLIIDTNMLENMIEFVKYGQPVIIASCTMAGSTGPVTLAGTIALSNAEILAGIAVAQLLRAGTPVFYGNQTTTADMKTGSIAAGSPEGALCYAMSARLAKAYGLPCRGGGAVTDAKFVSVQSGYESMLTLLSTAQAKTNLIIHSAGILDGYNAMSYEQLIVDLEIIGMVKRYLGGIEINEETLAVDVTKAVGPGGHFMSEEHTLKHCRKEPFLPAVSLRGKFSSNPDAAFTENIHHQIEMMLTLYEKPELDADLNQKILDYLIGQGYDPRPYME